MGIDFLEALEGFARGFADPKIERRKKEREAERAFRTKLDQTVRSRRELGELALDLEEEEFERRKKRRSDETQELMEQFPEFFESVSGVQPTQPLVGQSAITDVTGKTPGLGDQEQQFGDARQRQQEQEFGASKAIGDHRRDQSKKNIAANTTKKLQGFELGIKENTELLEADRAAFNQTAEQYNTAVKMVRFAQKNQHGAQRIKDLTATAKTLEDSLLKNKANLNNRLKIIDTLKEKKSGEEDRITEEQIKSISDAKAKTRSRIDKMEGISGKVKGAALRRVSNAQSSAELDDIVEELLIQSDIGLAEEEQKKLAREGAKPLGKETVQLRSQTQAAIAPLDNLIEGFGTKEKPGKFSKKTTQLLANLGTGTLADAARILDKDAQELALRANEAKSIILRIRSGAAVTPSEFDRLDFLFPRAFREDSLDVSALKGLKAEMENVLDGIATGRIAYTNKAGQALPPGSAMQDILGSSGTKTQRQFEVGQVVPTKQGKLRVSRIVNGQPKFVRAE